MQIIQRKQLRGAEIFACQLSNHLLDAGHEVRIICLAGGGAQLPFRGEITDLDRAISNRFVDLKGWRRLTEEIRSFKPDIVQSNAGDTLKYAVLSKLFFRWDAILVHRNAATVSDFIDSRAKFILNKFFYSRIDHVVSVSELCRQDMIKTFNYPSDQTDTVTIGVETKEAGEIPQDLEPIFRRGPVFLNIASFVPEKNHRGLLSVFRIVKERVADAQLILVGHGRLEEQTKAMANELQIHSDVHFVGNRMDVPGILKGSRALLLPSHIEGLPGVILEAQLCRTPVVAYDVGGIGEVVRHRQTGWLIEKDQEHAFADAVLEVVQGPGSIVDDIIGRAYHQVINAYDNAMIADQFLSIYRRLVSTR